MMTHRFLERSTAVGNEKVIITLTWMQNKHRDGVFCLNTLGYDPQKVVFETNQDCRWRSDLTWLETAGDDLSGVIE